MVLVYVSQEKTIKIVIFMFFSCGKYDFSSEFLKSGKVSYPVNVIKGLNFFENHEKLKLMQKRGQWISIYDQLGHFSSIFTKMTTVY